MAAEMVTMSGMRLGFVHIELGRDLKADNGEASQRDA